MWPNEEAGAGLPGAVRGKRTQGIRGGRGDPEGSSDLGSRPGPAACHRPAAGSSMKCLVTGSNVKGELGPDGGWGHVGRPKAPANQCFSSPPRSARQGRPLSVPYRGRTLPGAPGRRGEEPRYWGGCEIPTGSPNLGSSLAPIR